MSSTLSKQDKRQHCLQARQSLTPANVQAYSKAITQNLFALDSFQQAQSIASYMSTNNEVETSLIHQACWQKNKKLFLPAVQSDKSLHFVQHLPNDILTKSKFGIAEPTVTTNTPYIDCNNIGCLLIPLIGFDTKGGRIGYGGGYYDRYLQNKTKHTVCIGLAYEVQKVSSIKSETWDIGMDIIVTEEKNYLINI